MLQGVKYFQSGVGGGVVTFPNYFALNSGQTPNALNVKFSVGEIVEKRLGTSTTNAVALETPAGLGVFDFGATTIRWLVVSAGTGIYASSNRGLTFSVIASSRAANYQSFERSRSFLVATSEARDTVVYWAGSVGTTISVLAPSSAPATKYAIAYQGFLFLMNTAERPRGMYYSAENVITTDPWDSSFDLPSSFDDEITGAIILNRKLYVSMKNKIFRVSFVGGNPDFSYQDVKDWGWVPGTVKKITLPEVGEIIIALDWNRNLRVFDGSEDEIISDRFKDNNLEELVYMKNINLNALERCRAENDLNELVYKLLVPIGTATRPNHMICYNYRNKTYYPYDYTDRGMMQVLMAQSSNSQVLIGVDSGGRVHIMDSGNLDSGVSTVREFLDSPPIFDRTPESVSKISQIVLYFSPTSSGNIRYQDRTNFSNVYKQVDNILSFADTGNQLQKKFVIDVPQSQNVIQFRISNSGSSADPWKLVRQDVIGKPLGIGRG